MTTSGNQDIPRTPPYRQRKSKLWAIFTIVAIVVVGASIGWIVAKYLTSQGIERDSAALVLPRPDPFASRTPTGNLAGEEVRTNADARNQPVQKAAETVVGSYDAKLSYSIQEWTLGAAPSGFIDSATVNGRALGPNADMPALRGSDILELTGWTGDVSVGMRYPYVLISACDRIVAHSAVNLQRPDVAAAVHENLGLSGWRVTVAAAHLPKCKGAALQAWGVAPGDRKLLLPLNRQIALSEMAIEPGENLRFTAAAPPLRPGDLPPIAPAQLEVRTKVLNMRRCGRSDCAVTGQLAEGTWRVLVMGETVDWLLVVLPGGAGWVSRQFAEISRSQ